MGEVFAFIKLTTGLTGLNLHKSCFCFLCLSLIMKDLAFFNLFKSGLLLYSWNQLKNPKLLGSFFSQFSNFSPISMFWFEKTAYLIREGKFVYKKKHKSSLFRYKNKKNLVISLSQFVIELSFVNIIEKINGNNLVFDLTECLRYLKSK